jgi:hypothetical protein
MLLNQDFWSVPVNTLHVADWTHSDVIPHDPTEKTQLESLPVSADFRASPSFLPLPVRLHSDCCPARSCSVLVITVTHHSAISFLILAISPERGSSTLVLYCSLRMMKPLLASAPRKFKTHLPLLIGLHRSTTFARSRPQRHLGEACVRRSAVPLVMAQFGGLHPEKA